METRTSRGSSRRNAPQVQPAAVRPLRALFMHLSQPEVSAYGRQRIADHAAASMRVIQHGLSAIGHLLAQSAVQVEERTIPSESVESLGTLMAELGELAALCHELCREASESERQQGVLHEGAGS